MGAFKITLGVARIVLGYFMLWPFVDKMLGFGFTTEYADAWIRGGSPTSGFLEFAAKGPLKGMFNAMIGNPFVDWLFMIGLLCIGLALVLGVAMRLATVAGTLLFAFMFLAVLPPAHNPIIDEHIIYILLILVLFFSRADYYIGLGKWWQHSWIATKIPIFR